MVRETNLRVGERFAALPAPLRYSAPFNALGQAINRVSSPQESWHSKLKERLEGGNTRPAVRAIQELTPTTDPDAIRTLMEALSYRDQDVRENAAWALSLSAERHAAGALWAEAAEVLQAAAEGARDNEERRNMERAAATIEACLRNPG